MPERLKRARPSLLAVPAAAFFLFLGACAYGPAPSILIPAPEAQRPPKTETASLFPLSVLPTELPRDMTSVGTLFTLTGKNADLIPAKPLAPALDSILIADLRASGLTVRRAGGSDHRATLRLTLTLFRDKVKEKLLNVRHQARLQMTATLVLHEGGTIRTLTRTIERHRSPQPESSFHRTTSSALLGSLFSEAVTRDLIPYLRKQMGNRQ